MKLSVIIACLNCADTLPEQLEALAQQDFHEPWEVIIADNGSTDHLSEVVDSFKDRIPSLTLIDASAKRGCSFARNKGCEIASGESLLFCDGDDVVAPGWLAAMFRGLSDHDFVTGPADPDFLAKGVAATKLRSEVRVWNYLPFFPHAIGGNMGVKRWLHERVGGFDTSMIRGEDVEYSWRINIREQISPQFLQDAVLYVRGRPTLSATFKQQVSNGEYGAFLYKKYRAEGLIPKLSIKGGIRRWLDHLLNIRDLFSTQHRTRWIHRFALSVGQLKGSIKYRTLAL